MNESPLQAQIDAANAYEQLFVPALFQEWAPRMTHAAQIRSGHRVLDVACGTGVLAREAASCVGSSGFVVGVDPDPGMLAVATRLAPGIEWHKGTAESLPYVDQSFDAVVSQFGLTFFTDKNRSIREMVRVLAPDGHLAVAVWDSLENTPAYAAEVSLLERVAGPLAADALRAPFVLGDRKKLTTLFAEAGVASVSVTTHQGTARFPNIRSMVEADVRGWLPVMGVVQPEDKFQRILEEAENALCSYVTDEGTVTFPSPAHIITARKTRVLQSNAS